MNTRAVRPRPGLTGHIHSVNGAEAAPLWPNGLEITVLETRGGAVRVRDHAGREAELNALDLNLGWEYEIHDRWVPESDPEVLATLEHNLENYRADSWAPEIDRNRLELIENIEAILQRHGRKI